MRDRELLDRVKIGLLHAVPFDPGFRCSDESSSDTLRCGEFFRTQTRLYHDYRFGRTMVMLDGDTSRATCPCTMLPKKTLETITNKRSFRV